jgi:hypothetical protein
MIKYPPELLEYNFGAIKTRGKYQFYPKLNQGLMELKRQKLHIQNVKKVKSMWDHIMFKKSRYRFTIMGLKKKEATVPVPPLCDSGITCSGIITIGGATVAAARRRKSPWNILNWC